MPKLMEYLYNEWNDSTPPPRRSFLQDSEPKTQNSNTETSFQIFLSVSSVLMCTCSAYVYDITLNACADATNV